MSQIIIKTEATDEQIALAAAHLGYQAKIQKEVQKEITEKNEKDEDIKVTVNKIVDIDNPETDDEFLRKKCAEVIINLIGNSFVQGQLNKMEQDKQAMLDASKKALTEAITTEKI